MLRNRAFVGLVVVLALVGTACVTDNEPEPGVRAITTDLQYKELQKKNAAPPNTVPQPQQPIGPIPTLEPLDNDVGPIFPPQETCPTAAPTEQADEDVTLTVSRLPEEGSYLWRVSGYETQGKNKLALPGFTRRKVDKVEGTIGNDTPEFTFETTERELSALNPAAATIRSTFQVTSQTATDNTVRRGDQSSGRTSTAGVKLTGIVREVPGEGTTSFVPSTPVRYLITPAIVGPDRFWQDQVVDVSGSEPQTLTHRAFVKGRQTIDACGERVRGWLVAADQTYQRGSERVTRHFEYAVATQLGGIVIFEDVKSPCTYTDGKCDEGDPVLSYKANLGKKE